METPGIYYKIGIKFRNSFKGLYQFIFTLQTHNDTQDKKKLIGVDWWPK